MKKSKLIFASAPLSVVAMTTSLFAASCSCNKGDQLITPVITVEHGTAICSKVWLNEEFRVAFKADNGWELQTVTIVIGEKTLVKDAEDGYVIDGNVIIVKAKAVNSTKITISITARELKQEEKITITEPGDASARQSIANSYGRLVIDKTKPQGEQIDGAVYYNFPFSGEFQAPFDLTTHALAASATLGYVQDNNASSTESEVTWTVGCEIEPEEDPTKFKLDLYNTFSASTSSTYHIWDIPGDYNKYNVKVEEITITDVTDESNPKKYKCQQKYEARIQPNIIAVDAGQGIELEVVGSSPNMSYYDKMNTEYYYANAPEGFNNPSNLKITNIVTNNTNLKPYDAFISADPTNTNILKVTSDQNHQKFEYNSALTKGNYPIGFDITDGTTTYFKVELNSSNVKVVKKP